MSKLKIYIVEDEPLYADQLEMLVDELGYELAGISENSDTAKVEIEKQRPDLLLIDINVNGTMDGIELLTSLKGEFPAIFITSFTDKETFDRAKVTNPYAYLAKPFDAQNLQRTIELAFNSTRQSEVKNSWQQDVMLHDAFFIKKRSKLEKVEIGQIQYLEVEDRYSTVFTEGGDKYVLRMSMGELQNKLPAKQFLRVHRKYAVNLMKVKSIDLQDSLLSVGDAQIPISRSHKEELLKHLEWLQ